MGFSGSYVPGIHRKPKAKKAFGKIKHRGNYSPFKYGEKFGKGKYVLDEKRMEAANREKENHWYLTFFGVLVFGFIISYAVFEFVIGPQLQDAQVWSSPERYDWRGHSSDATIMEIKNRKTLKEGYLAWAEGDYDKAILAFEKAEDDSGFWWRKEHALLGVYSDRCYHLNQDCIKYEAYRNILRTASGELLLPKDEERYYKNVIKYNKEMLEFFEKEVRE